MAGRLHEANEGAEQQHFGMAIEMPGMMDQDRKARMISHSYNNYYANGAQKFANCSFRWAAAHLS